MKYFVLFLLSVLCVACSVVKQAAPSENTRIETRVERIFETDTVFLQIPVRVEKVHTLDTASFLENEFAKSSAEVSKGILSHSLETKPISKPVEVKKEIVYRDSIIVKDNVIVQTVEVEKSLTGWQNFKMKTGGFALGLLVIAIVCLVLYIVKPLNLFKL